MRRFFVDPLAITAETAYLSTTESKHVASVLRLQVGDDVELFDGTGTVYHGHISHLSPDKVRVHILSSGREEREVNTALVLYLGMLKGKKMDFLIQKSTELGVFAVQPVFTRYCENRGNHSRQLERWHRIMLEACKQCNRPVPMKIHPVAEMHKLTFPSDAVKLLLWEKEHQQPVTAEMFTGNGPVCVFTGPEGGFRDDEVDLARNHGFQTITLGKSILRAETAALSITAIIQYLLGRLGK